MSQRSERESVSKQPEGGEFELDNENYFLDFSLRQPEQMLE